MRSLPTRCINTIFLVFGLRLQFLILFTKFELLLNDLIIIIEGKCVYVRQFSEFEARPTSYFSSFPQMKQCILFQTLNFGFYGK